MKNKAKMNQKAQEKTVNVAERSTELLTLSTPPRTRARKPKEPGDKPGPNPDIGWHDLFIKVLGQTANVAGACRACKISRTAAYDHKKKQEDFKAAWEEAENLALDRLFTVALDHATNGTIRPVYQQGKRVGEIIEYDHRLLEWLLERKRPSEFSNKQRIEHLGGLVLQTPEETAARGEAVKASLIATLKAAAGLGRPRIVE